MPHFSHPQKKHTHIHIRERERDSEREIKRRKRSAFVVARVKFGYESENVVRKFFLFFFARQRGESKLERDSEMVRR